MTTLSPLADACPKCPPGDFPAVTPSSVALDEESGSLRAAYEHAVCGAEWACDWDAEAAGWPSLTEGAKASGGDYAEQLKTELACPDCPAEIRVTIGSSRYLPYRARVIHTADCPWFPRYQARTLDQRHDYTGAIPCSTQVTHRGPYKRDPMKRGEAA